MKKTRRRLLLWFKTARPILFPLLPILFLLGMERGGEVVTSLTLIEWCFVLALTWPLSLIIYGINDIFDREYDAANTERESVLSDGDVPVIITGLYGAMVLLMGASVLMMGSYGVVFVAVMVLASWLYSAPPVRIKERPIIDIVFSGLMYGGVLYTVGYSYALGHLAVSVNAWLLTLLAMSVHALGTLRDYYEDKQQGLTTTAVALGRVPTIGLTMVIILVCMALSTHYRGVIIAELVFYSGLLFIAFAVYGEQQWLRVKRLQLCLILLLYAGGLYKLFF